MCSVACATDCDAVRCSLSLPSGPEPCLPFSARERHRAQCNVTPTRVTQGQWVDRGMETEMRLSGCPAVALAREAAPRRARRLRSNEDATGSSVLSAPTAAAAPPRQHHLHLSSASRRRTRPRREPHTNVECCHLTFLHRRVASRSAAPFAILLSSVTVDDLVVTASMSDIRFFFAGKPSAGGGGSKAESGRPRPSSPSKKASASSSSASSRAFDGGSGDGSNGGSARKERKVKTSKADDDSKAGARPAGRVKVDPLQPEKRRSDQKESGRRSSYFSVADTPQHARPAPLPILPLSPHTSGASADCV